jgi:phage-related protein
MAGPIRIAVLADVRNAVRGLQDTRTSAQKLGDGFRNMAAPATGALLGLGALAKGTIDLASANEQSLGATQTVFGKYADTVIKRSKEATDALGLTSNEYRELANSLGASLTNAGVSMDKLGGQTDGLISRASDMAATFGGTTKEAVEAVSSALRGESDPIERYGVSLNEAAVNAYLAKKGLDDLTGSALDQAKMQARQAILMDQTSKITGQFAREANTAAGAVERNNARSAELATTIGTHLLPIWVQLQTAFASILEVVSQNTGLVVGLGAGLAALAGFVLAVNAAMAVARAATAAWTAVQWLLNSALFANPIGIVILAIVALVAIIVVAYQRSETFRRIVGKAFEWVQNAAAAAWNWIKGNWPLLLAIITGPIGLAVRWVIQNFDRIKAFVRTIPDTIRSAFASAGSWLVSAGRNVVNGLWNGIAGAGSWVWGKITSFVSTYITGPINRALGIASPSKVGKKIGEWFSIGVGEGVDSAGAVNRVRRAAGKLTAATIPDAPTGATGTGGELRLVVAAGASDEFTRLLVELIRKFVTVQGGSVQRALGGA